ncbi:hypothetical protein [Psychrobacter sp. FDAARGOS_221]|uniref:hypothetical protein n=1 Tax=Psychrobacter sp. FDAARGOS_221 TaxID=1975705 RepID=UPI000BB59DEE|nr:hypothetical protein [Psychrobacter sp. FDAARGOS_221]PNK60852.1 hypothetical protein A6J60_008150 [Psychrobacter sp. FDAARGOS_221]
MKPLVSPVFILTGLLLAGIVPASAQSPSSSATTSKPEPELIAGSYANQILRQDTAAALVEKGYIKPLDNIMPFIIDQPTGPTGQKNMA